MKIIDLHCDTISKLMKDKNRLGLKRNHCSVDIEKLKKGKSIAQFFALYIDLKAERDPLEACLEMLDKFYEELFKNKEDIALARDYKEYIENDRRGRISAFLTVEEGGVLKGKLYHLRNLYRLGVRLLTLTWNYPNEIGYPNCKTEYREKGLTHFGEKVVYAMNRLGMIIDVSHLSDQGFYDVARLSSVPFIASHSNARSITNHTRNLTDQMIKMIANKGGVIGINFAKEFLGEGFTSSIDDILHHIQHIYQIGGIEVLSLGTDFDGIHSKLEIQNIGEIQKLIEALKRTGFSEEAIEKIGYKNALRIIKDVLRE